MSTASATIHAVEIDSPRDTAAMAMAGATFNGSNQQMQVYTNALELAP